MSNKVFCTNCGKQIDAISNYCISCGAKNLYYVNNKDKKTEVKIKKEIDKKQIIKNSNIQAKTKDSQSYFIKHWRGQLSLSVSYWVNNVLLNLFFLLITTIAIDYIDFTTGTIFAPVSIIFVWILAFLLTVWSLVGLWRSADKNMEHNSISFWSTVVKFLVVIGWMQSFVYFINSGVPQVTEYTKIILGIDKTGDYNLEILNNDKELEVSGDINFGLTNDVKKYFKQYPNINVIHLNSKGGMIAEAKKLAGYFKNKDITTYSSQYCNSACVDIFLAGKHRYLNKNATLGFHQPYFPGLTKEEQDKMTYQQKQYYLKKGINKKFVDKAFSTPHNDMWVPSHYELLEAGVVHKVVDGAKLAATDLAIFKDPKKVESALLSLPVFQTIKEVEPQAFIQIKQIINESVLRGDSKEKMFGKTQSIVTEINAKYLPYSSDNAIINSFSLIIELMKKIYDKDPLAAYDYATGKNNIDLKSFYTPSMQKHERSIMNEVIQSGAKHPQKAPSEKVVEKIYDKLILLLDNKIGAGNGIKVMSVIYEKSTQKKETAALLLIYYQTIMELTYVDRVKLVRSIFAGFDKTNGNTANTIPTKKQKSLENTKTKAMSILSYSIKDCNNYFKGNKTKVDYQKSLDSCNFACNLGYSKECLFAADIYDFGKNVERNPNKAASYYSSACKLDNPIGCLNLASMIRTSEIENREYKKAISYYRKGCQLGNWDSCLSTGRILLSEQDYDGAYIYYKKACDNGIADGCTYLGSLYEFGMGTKQNITKAFNLYRQGCDEGSAVGCVNLGLMYAEGKHIKINEKKGFNLTKKGCEQGSGLGCSNLAHLYRFGMGVKKNKKMAAKFFKKACDMREIRGCVGLGQSYHFGWGIKQDYIKAAQLYKETCDLNHAEACSNLGILYNDGLGVKQSYKKAIELYQKSCDMGKNTGCINLDRLKKKMK